MRLGSLARYMDSNRERRNVAGVVVENSWRHSMLEAGSDTTRPHDGEA